MLVESAASRPSIEGMVNSYKSNDELTQYRGIQFGLERYSDFDSAKHLQIKWDDTYLEKDRTGRIISFFRCSPDGDDKIPGCIHYFIDNGMFLKIHYSKDVYFYDWRSMREGAVQFLNQFEVNEYNMVSLTTQQLDNLQNKLNAGNVSGFYSDLGSYGDGYGRLGLAVTNNDGWQGQLANSFAANGAKSDGKDLRWGTPEWREVNQTLAEGYLQLYRENNGVQPNGKRIQDLHNQTYGDAGLNVDNWLTNKLLNSSSDPDALWDDYMNNTGPGDLWDDALGVLDQSMNVVPGTPPIPYLDPANLDFTSGLIKALWDMSPEAREQFLNDYTKFKDLMDFLDGIKNDYGWALDNPDAILGLLPDWLKPAGAGFGQASTLTSPLVLDLDGDGVETSALGYGDGRSTTYFDIDNDGFAERTGWATGGDGLLALDKNGNGKIDNQGELFGNSATYADGFAALKALDSNNDNKITSADAQWSKLRVWVDADKDGATDAGELKTLADLKITQINLNATAQSNVFNNENPVTASSTFVMNGGTRTMSDVWFRNDQTDTRFLGDYTLNVKTLFLPTLKGFGNLKDLHVAMSGNAGLLTLVENFVKNWSPSRLTNTALLDADVKAILFKWAGVESVSSTSRGAYVDGKIIAFMEKLTGEYFGGGTTPLNPGGPGQGEAVTKSFEMAFSAVKTQLIVQAGGDALFDQPPVYSLASGNIYGGVLGSAGIATLKTQAGTASDKLGYWKVVTDFLLNVKGASEFTSAERTALDAAIKATVGSSYSWDSLVSLVSSPLSLNVMGTEQSDYFVGGRGADNLAGRGGDDILDGGEERDTLNGGDGNDILTGGGGDDWLYGGKGNDSLDGGEGKDSLYGEDEDDVLTGGGGDDTLYGGKGNDTYLFNTGFGKDYISDEAGSDVIKFGTGITASSLRFERSSNDLRECQGFRVRGFREPVDVSRIIAPCLESDRRTG
jgi:hypothetical protein